MSWSPVLIGFAGTTLLMALQRFAQEEAEKQQLRQSFSMYVAPEVVEAIVGNIGASRRMQYTALGDTVNLAARLQETTKQMEVSLLVTQEVRDEAEPILKDNVRFVPRGDATLRGGERSVSVYEVSRSDAGSILIFHPDKGKLVFEYVVGGKAAVKGIISKPSFQPADVTAIARLVETMLRAQARKKGVELSVAAELVLEVHSVHGPFSNPTEEAWDISNPDDAQRAGAVASHARVIRAAAKLGASHVVIHAGLRDRSGFRSAHCRASLEELSDAAREAGIKLAVENLPPDYLVSSVADVRRMIDGLDPDVVGFCLDTGHAMLGSDSPTDYVRAFHDRLLGVHWHYNDGKNDTHLFPSHEHSDWRAFLAALAETGYDLPVTVEAVPPDGLSLREAFRAAREVFRQDNGKDNAARGIPGTCEMCDNSVVQSHRPEASR